MSGSFFTTPTSTKKNTFVYIDLYQTLDEIIVLVYFNKELTKYNYKNNDSSEKVKSLYLIQTLNNILKGINDKTIKLEINCRNVWFYNLMNEWRKLWKKDDYQIILNNQLKGSRFFSTELKEFDKISESFTEEIKFVQQNDKTPWKLIDEEIYQGISVSGLTAPCS
jgi:hypothetical protein